MNIAFAGLRHPHIFVLYDMAEQNELYHICGAFEMNAQARVQAKKRGVVCSYDSYEDLLADETVEAVALGGCYGERGEMAIAALKAGKHVIADKPLCTSLEELDTIESLAKEKGLLVSCMFTMRFEPQVNAVKKLIESGTLGEINNVYFGGQHPLQYGRRPAWYFEEGKHGGVFNDIAIHGIDVLSFALGLEVQQIEAARCWNKYAAAQPQFKDSAQGMLTAKNGAGILLDVSYAIPDGIEFLHPQYWRFQVWGTNGSVSFSLNEKDTYYFVAGDAVPHVLMAQEPPCDYLTDFYHLAQGEPAVLSPREVFASTRKALELQRFADETEATV